MSIGLLAGIATLLAMAAFVGVVWWTYRPARKAGFERIARSIVDQD
jgi:cbb3-type cytochrome oxidase subunit 3